MTDYYWPNSSPTELHMDYIMQVRYSIQAMDDEDVYQITQKNFYDDDPVAKHHCFIPSYYGLHVIFFLWKYYLYISLYSWFHCHHQKKKKPNPFLPYLSRCIVCLDNVIEAFIWPILSIPFDKIADYHSKSFDEYLITEIILGHHDHEAFRIFHSRCPINIKRMDAEDFTDYWAWHGGLLPAWHRGRLPRLMEGMEYNYDVDMVPDEDWGALWKEVQEWHKCKLDTEWISSYVPWEDNDRKIIYPPTHQPYGNLSESYPGSPDHGSYDPFDVDMRSMEIKREELEEGARPIGFDSPLVAASMDQPTSSVQSREPCQGKDQIFEEETIGCPVGSSKKGKAKQTERGPEFVTTHVLQSKAHHPSSELQYDKVVVTISPCKKPIVTSGCSQQLCDVSPTILRPTAGPSHSSKLMIQTASTPSDEAIQDDVPSVLKNLPAVLHSLAKKSIGDEEDIVEQFVKVFSTLKDISKTHQLQVSTMFSKIKANKHAYYLKCNLVEDVMRLGMYLKKKERELRNDGKDVDMSVKKGYTILACVGTAVYSVQTPTNIVSLHLAPVKYVQSSPDKVKYVQPSPDKVC
ncbi:hypothetical protein EDC04DRAFT_2603687 [Pisolithus marmoratus]|nr:hypothetical protein EDC04DRAFT_2603687 [Pisolithus marmoratus]